MNVPMRRANPFFHSARPNSAITPISAPRPISPGTMSEEVARRCRTRMTTATMGRPSLMKLFQIAVSVMDSPISAGSNPHARYMPTVTPLATTPPPGTVFATVVDDWLFTAAWAMVSPGKEAVICGQYVKTLNAVTATRIRTSRSERLLIVSHTFP